MGPSDYIGTLRFEKELMNLDNNIIHRGEDASGRGKY